MDARNKFTPGPWVVCDGGPQLSTNIREKCIRQSPDGVSFIATGNTEAGGLITEEMRDANAALIAAAPEMLEALERCVAALASMDKANCDSANLARQAIAKATGDNT